VVRGNIRWLVRQQITAPNKKKIHSKRPPGSKDISFRGKTRFGGKKKQAW
jgi:hypothetical protein